MLVVTATAGFRHDSIDAAREVLTSASFAGEDLAITTTDTVAGLSASALAGYDVLGFVLTSGELPLTDDQKRAIVDFVRGGKGFFGVHSATDTLYGWADYGQMIGAYFQEHPWTQPGAVVVEDTAHPATRGLPSRFTIHEEFYTFRENPRPRVQVLLRLDAASVNASGDFPLAWSQTFGEGRVYYNALGHFAETWRDSRFQLQLAGALRWLGRR